MADKYESGSATSHPQPSPAVAAAMESWLLDVKKVRIPRPKFAGGARRPREPPKDYYGCGEEARGAAAAVADEQRALAAATEELRRAVQEKL